MARIMFTNYKCPICKNEVHYPPGYNPKTAKDNGNVEWILTKRGLKQFFHTNCYWALIQAQKIEREVINEN